MEDYELFNRNTQAIIYGFQRNPIQRMLDFDFVSKREKQSVAAIIRPTQTAAISYHKVFYGNKEIVIPIYKTLELAMKKHPNADVIINLPKFKSHQQLKATFAVKNMFGCVSGKRKALWHFRKGGSVDDFCELLIDIYRFLNPVLTIIDAVTAMDGPGPINGKARALGSPESYP